MPRVRLGNSAPAQPGVSGNSVTVADIPGSYTISEALRTLFHPDGVWRAHSDATQPDWVEVADDPLLEEAIAEASGCVIGCPNEWES